MDQARSDRKSPPPALDVRDRVSIINALMTQDRIEIRDKQEAVFRLTYYVIPGIVGIAAFSVGHPELKSVLVAAHVLLMALYASAFAAFRRWLWDARACLRIREEYYRNQDLLASEPFDPVRPIEKKDRMGGFRDNAVWFPFAATGLAWIGLLVFLLSA